MSAWRICLRHMIRPRAIDRENEIIFHTVRAQSCHGASIPAGHQGQSSKAPFSPQVEAGHLSAAVKLGEALMASDPTAPGPTHALATLYMALGRVGEAWRLRNGSALPATPTQARPSLSALWLCQRELEFLVENAVWPLPASCGGEGDGEGRRWCCVGGGFPPGRSPDLLYTYLMVGTFLDGRWSPLTADSFVL
jgi:hypothetical protein